MAVTTLCACCLHAAVRPYPALAAHTCYRCGERCESGRCLGASC